MTANDIKTKYIEFFTDKIRNHKQIPPAPLVPPEDPTTLFTNSGMQQLVPYLKGEPHPMGKRLVDSQPCFRADDIEEIGDNRHTTFFEMLGNWSLGDYFKKEQLTWCFKFFTKAINLNPDNLYVSIFAGDNIAPKDKVSIKIWQELFNTKEPELNGEKGFSSKTKIYSYDASKNWWSRAGVPEKMPPGEIGGTTSEVFYDFGSRYRLHQNSKYNDQICHLNCDCGRFLEIGNSVFMEYEKQKDGSFKSLPKQNVDFGGGLERIAAAAQNTPDVFKTDLFSPIIQKIEKVTNKNYDDHPESMRIIADHLRGATLIIAQGTQPSNKLQGYFVRRLLRRAVVKMRILNADDTENVLTASAKEILTMFDGMYLKKSQVKDAVTQSIKEEINKFNRTVSKGLKEIEKRKPEEIDTKLAFDLYQTYGFPFEITKEILEEKGKKLSQKDFKKELSKHQQQSRTSSAGMFKGGLADKSETTIKLHTATHLLHQSLRAILGNQVKQEGSHITAERLRFDFYYLERITNEQVKKIENLINQKIKEDLPVHKTIEKKDKALESGALAFFKETYPNKVSVYTIGKDTNKDWFSKELCGGPHVPSTGEIGGVTIKKIKSIGANTRRIYVVLSSVNANKANVRN